MLAYALSTALCMYTHYFSFLFAAIVGITGLFCMKASNFKDYLLAGMLSILAFVPHLGISGEQLSRGGIGSWLGKSGLGDATFKSILEKSQWDSPALRRMMDIIVSGKFKPRKSWMPKDVGFGLDMAREMEVPMPFVGLAQQMFAIAQATGQDGYEATGIACNVYNVINGKQN